MCLCYVEDGKQAGSLLSTELSSPLMDVGKPNIVFFLLQFTVDVFN